MSKSKVNGFSIIITAFKSHNYIEECLDSIALQTYFNGNDKYEILLGIDCCEETLDKVNIISGKYPNLRVLYMTKNMGTYVTSNTLLSLVNYENIIRFDSDDIMLPNMVSKINENIINNDLIRFSYYNFNDGEDFITSYNPNSTAHGVVYYNEKIIKDLGGYKNWPCSADSDLLYRLKNEHRVLNIKEGLFYRRIHKNSLTKNDETGMHTKLRSFYRSKLKKSFEYVKPIINDYIEIDATAYNDVIEYKFLEKEIPPKRPTYQPGKYGFRKKIAPKPNPKIIKPKNNNPNISKKAIPTDTNKLYLPNNGNNRTQIIHDEINLGKIRKGRGFSPRHKKW